MLAGRLRIDRCEPHLHDTYTIALLRRGTAAVKVRSQPWLWSEGSIFVASPYEVHGGGGLDEAIDYEVFYPSISIMLEALGISPRDGLLPRFPCAVLHDTDIVAELTEVLFSSRAPGACDAALEQDLMRCLRRHSRHLSFSMLEMDEVTPVRTACRIMQEALDSTSGTARDWLDLPAQVGISRYYFIRLFHKVTGLAPNAYFRQLRLSKARRLICCGHSVVDAAIETGFADQAHLTREFRRSFASTPGKVARDLLPHAQLSLA
jgi:AraC-like DNA-binding protein